MTFDSFGLSNILLNNIKTQGYTAPTPIQERAIPAAIEGRDLMGLAQTGTGKTAAFLLPIINKLMKRPAGNRRRARALILAPTRELAEQIHESALDLAKATGLRSTTVYGGVNMNRQINALRNGADIVVACPGRLLDHMGQRTVDLGGVECLVLDEADQMFDMGFLPDIKKVLAGLPKERQTMLFSATMPEAIRSLAGDILKEPETLRVGHTAPAETVSHAIYPVAHHLKTKLLLELLRQNTEGSVLVFTRTKHRAKRLAENLEKLGHKSTALQGNLSQNRRKEAMDGFRSGRYRILVATDIAARGIDVSQITHVVNFDVPSTPETYTHRIGRTGRAARTGEAHTFVTAEDVSMVRAIERLMREPLTRKKVEGFNYEEAPSANAADKDFNRPIMDRFGGRGGDRRSGFGGPRAGGERRERRPERTERSAEGRSENRTEGRADDRGIRRDDRRSEPRFDRRPEGRSERGNEWRADDRGNRAPRPDNRADNRGNRVDNRRDDNRPARRPERAGGYAQQGAQGAQGDKSPLWGKRRTYGSLRSENPDRPDVDGNRIQPGDDIYTADPRENRRYGNRPGSGHGGNGRPQGQYGQGQRPQGERRAGERNGNTRQDRPGQGHSGQGRPAPARFGDDQRPQGDRPPRRRREEGEAAGETL